MKYKQIKPLPETFKIEVTPEQSKAVQKALFKVGKRWVDGNKKIQLTDSRYLFTYIKDITRSNRCEEFKNHKNPEITFTDYFTEKQTKSDLLKRIEVLEKDLKRRKTVVISGAECIVPIKDPTEDLKKMFEAMRSAKEMAEILKKLTHKDEPKPDPAPENIYFDLSKLAISGFSEIIDSVKSKQAGFETQPIEIRNGGLYKNKAFYLDDYKIDWELKKDDQNHLCLIPTKKTK